MKNTINKNRDKSLYQKNYYQENKEEIKRKVREYKRKNRTEIRKKDREYKRKKYKENPTLRIEDNKRGRDWYKRNKEERIKKIMDTRKKNLDKYRKYQKEYMLEYIKKPQNKIKAEIRQQTYSKLRKKIIKKYGCCQTCGSKERLQIHHKKYNLNEKDLIVVCLKCHYKIHNQQSVKNFKSGLLTDKKGCVGFHLPTSLFFNRPNIDNTIFNKFIGQNLQGL